MKKKKKRGQKDETAIKTGKVGMQENREVGGKKKGQKDRWKKKEKDVERRGLWRTKKIMQADEEYGEKIRCRERGGRWK